MSELQVKLVLSDAVQLLILFVGTLTYLEPKLFLLVMLYNGTFLIIEILPAFTANVYIHSHCIMVYLTALTELLLLSK
jgi:hypothetical protein